MAQSAKNGSVLLVVLLVMASAAYLILESGRFLRVDYAGASARRTLVAGGSLLRSGQSVAKELLLEDLKKGGDADHRFEEWANIGGVFAEMSESLESGELHGELESEDGRINLGALKGDTDSARDLGEIFVRLVDRLRRAHEIQGDPEEFLASIRIWLGAKDEQEDAAWYAARDVAYEPAGKFTVPDELLLVRWKGVDPEDVRLLYFGSDSIPGLKDFVTVWGEGAINVNAARREVLRAISPDDKRAGDFAVEVEAYREQGDNLFSGAWYEAAAVRAGLDAGALPSKALSVKSTVFRLHLTATVGAGQLNSTSILSRSSGRCVVLFENIH